MRNKLLLAQKRYDDLLQSCDRAVDSVAKPPVELYTLRGLAKENLEDYSGAIADYTLALEQSRSADRTFLIRCRGWCYLQIEAYLVAAGHFDEILQFTSSDADAFSGRGLRGEPGPTPGGHVRRRCRIHLRQIRLEDHAQFRRTYAQAAIAAETES